MLYAATGAQSFMIPFRPEHPSQPAPGPRSLTTVPCTAVWAQPSLLPTGLLTNQACSPAWPSLQRRTKSISVSHKSCLAQAPGIAPEALLGGISTSMHGQAPPLPSPCQYPLSELLILSPCAPPPPLIATTLQLLGSLRSLQHPELRLDLFRHLTKL